MKIPTNQYGSIIRFLVLLCAFVSVMQNGTAQTAISFDPNDPSNIQSNCDHELKTINDKINKLNQDYNYKKEEMKKGLFCSECVHSKTEIEKNGEEFYAHLKKVGGHVVPATNEQFQKAHEQYMAKFNSLKDSYTSKQKDCGVKYENAVKAKQQKEQEKINEQNRKNKENQDKQNQAYLENQKKIDQQNQERLAKQQAEYDATLNNYNNYLEQQKQQNLSDAEMKYGEADNEKNQRLTELSKNNSKNIKNYNNSDKADQIQDINVDDAVQNNIIADGFADNINFNRLESNSYVSAIEEKNDLEETPNNINFSLNSYCKEVKDVLIHATKWVIDDNVDELTDESVEAYETLVRITLRNNPNRRQIMKGYKTLSKITEAHSDALDEINESPDVKFNPEVYEKAFVKSMFLSVVPKPISEKYEKVKTIYERFNEVAPQTVETIKNNTNSAIIKIYSMIPDCLKIYPPLKEDDE